jgi:hypothetical protein
MSFCDAGSVPVMALFSEVLHPLQYSSSWPLHLDLTFSYDYELSYTLKPHAFVSGLYFFINACLLVGITAVLFGF